MERQRPAGIDPSEWRCCCDVVSYVGAVPGDCPDVMAPVRPFVPHVRKGGTLTVFVGKECRMRLGGPDYPMERQRPAGI